MLFVGSIAVVPEMLVGGVADWNADGRKNWRRAIPGETQIERDQALDLGTVWNFEVRVHPLVFL